VLDRHLRAVGRLRAHHIDCNDKQVYDQLQSAERVVNTPVTRNDGNACTADACDTTNVSALHHDGLNDQ
jgi:hypothetical protein